ncbi:MAG: dynamin family protein [Verrucomicrobiota bacterium]
MPNPAKLGEIIDRLQILFSESESNAPLNTPVAPVLQNSVQRLDRIRKRLNAKQVFAVMVGQTNTGKSTLLSALLGQEVFPIKNAIWSSVPVEISYGEELCAWVSFPGTIERDQCKFNSPEELNKFIAKTGTAGAEYNAGQVNLLVAEMPSPFLRNGLTIVDTPGFAAAQLGAGGEKSHETATVDYLTKLDKRDSVCAQVYWLVSRGEGGIGREEMTFYKKHLHKRCADLVINHVAASGERHADPKFQLNFRRKFGDYFDPLIRWHFLDAKEALKAKTDNSPDSLAASGIQTLIDSMSSMAGEAYAEIAANAIVNLWDDLNAWMTEEGVIKASQLWKKSRLNEMRHLATTNGLVLK